MTGFDPMFDQLNSQIQVEQQKQLKNLWRKLEGFAHHNSKPEEELRRCLEELEKTVFYLLAPITAEDQKKIQKILSCSDRSETDIERMFFLIERRGANFAFFFKHAAENADATWLPLLDKRGYFTDPPNVESIDDDRVIFPFWWPIHYLAKIANHAPDKVIETVRGLPKVNNPRVYNGILEIALSLQEEQSAALKPKILESIDIDHQAFPQRYEDLLAHWVAENQTSAALELTKVLVEFAPDSQSEAKQKRRRENPMNPGTFWETSLEPLPQIDYWDYTEIMSKGVRPLAEKEPYQVAHLLTKEAANMIRLRTHQDDLDQKVDSSQIWYERLDGLDTGYQDPDKTLVHTLIFACKQVYKKSPDSVVALDKILRNQQWEVFKLLRQYLYAQYPNEQTKPWIREIILEHEEYHLWEYRYEFQRMIRSACEHFGETLLTEAERAQIFNAIRSGPPKENFQKLMGEKFTEYDFRQHQRGFHRKQFKPFESLLFGEYATYFRELEDKATDPISDEDYLPIRTKSGFVSYRSPIAFEDLTKFTDEELLSYVNEWEEERTSYEDNPFVEINIKALAETFQAVFKDMIIPNVNRSRFWIENRKKIQRPIYVRMMINGMKAHIKKKDFDNLSKWLAFGEWVLSHPNGDTYKLSEESRENPDWHSSRRAVGDLIEACLKEEVDVPISARGQLAQLLEMLCTQFDSWLDLGKRVLLSQDDPFAEGINNTRSLALHALVNFGFWLRRHDSESKTPEITAILEKRFALQTEHPLTPPEYAILR